MECCPRKLHSLATAWASHIVAVLMHFRLSPYPRPPSGRHCMQNLANLAAETSANTCTEAAKRSPGRLVLDRPGRREAARSRLAVVKWPGSVTQSGLRLLRSVRCRKQVRCG